MLLAFLACSASFDDAPPAVGVTTHDYGTAIVSAEDCATTDAVYIDGVELEGGASCNEPFKGEGFASEASSVLEIGDFVHELGPVFVPVSAAVTVQQGTTVEIELLDAPEHVVYGFEPVGAVDPASIVQDGSFVTFEITESFDGQPLDLITLRQQSVDGVQLNSFYETQLRL